MSGSYHFYMFLNRLDGGFQAFKSAADTNKNNSIEFNELYQFINNNAELKKDITKKDMYEIWDGLDTYSRGENADSTNGVSEVGSLNNNEQNNMEKRIILYGEMSIKVEKIVDDNITVFDAFETFGLDKTSIIAEIIEAVIKEYKTSSTDKILSMLRSGQLDTSIKKQAKNIAINEIKDKLVDTVIADKVFPKGLNYNVHQDEDLMGLITRYITTSIEDNILNLDDMVDDLIEIVEAYLKTAKIEGADPWNCPDEYQWDPYNNTMNTLQLAVLTNKYETVLKAADYTEYGGLSAVLPKITEYLNFLNNDWSARLSEEFDDLYDVSDDKIIEDFKSSDILGAPSGTPAMDPSNINYGDMNDDEVELTIGDIKQRIDDQIKTQLEIKAKAVCICYNIEWTDDVYKKFKSIYASSRNNSIYLNMYNIFKQSHTGGPEDPFTISPTCSHNDEQGVCTILDIAKNTAKYTCQGFTKWAKENDNRAGETEDPEDPEDPEAQPVTFDDINYSELTLKNWRFESLSQLYNEFPEIKQQLKDKVGDTLTSSEFEKMWKNSFDGIVYKGNTGYYYFNSEYKPGETILKEKVARKIVSSFASQYREKIGE